MRVRAVLGLLTTLLVVTGCATAPASSLPSRGPDPAVSGVERLTDGRAVPPLRWGPCADAPAPGFECAELVVPTDYREPGSPPMTLAVSRMPATDPERRRGVLLSNPGGPGAPGRWNTLGVDQLTDGRLRAHYDLVGLDVRGTGASRPAARCGFTGRLLAAATAEPDAIDFDRDVAESRAMAASCTRAMGALLPHLGTVDVARDMDVLRAALGEPRLSFSGVSYGTSLGTAYASMFPDRTDRVLLTSADDDTVGWRERFRASNAAFDARFAEVAASIAASPRWELGDAAEVRARYLDLRDRAAPGTLTVDGVPLEVRSLRLVAEDALRGGGEFVDDLAGLLAHAGGLPGAPDARAVAALLRSVSVEAMASEAGGAVELDQQAAAGFAVRCGETAWPRDLGTYRRTFEAERDAHPVSGGARATVEPCAFWSAAARDPLPRLTDVGHEGRPQALILHHRSDPATPLDGALRTRAALGSRAVMITVGRGGHGVLGRDACATDAAVDWLVDGDLPDTDTTC